MAAISVDARLPEHEQEELYMLSRRDSVEKDRLDQQSNLIRIVRGGHVLDPSIPKDSVAKVADVATGTGIWLREVEAELAAAGCRSAFEGVGFDVSADQFPLTPTSGTRFVVWDATKPFPVEYHNSFDVVHVRLLTVAVTTEQIKAIATNLVDLIKPGGYLQWTDWTYTNGHAVIYPSSSEASGSSADSDQVEPLSLAHEGQMMYDFHGAQGFSYDTTGDVAAALRRLPAVEQPVRITDHTGAARRQPEIRPAVAEWHARVIPLFMEMMSRRQGQSEREAAATAERYRAKAVEMGRRGTVFEVPITTLVARKGSA